MKKYLLVLMLLAAGFRQAYTQCTANAGPAETLTCATTSVTLFGSSNIQGATYLWEGPSGYTSNLQNPVVNTVGTYSLTITDPSNGCTATASTMVVSNTVEPAVSVLPATLTCAMPVVTLVAIPNPFNSQFVWIGPGGYSSTVQNPTVSLPGIYSVIVTDPVNGCTAISSVTVDQDIAVPTLDASVSGTIGCTPSNITLTASSNWPGVTFNWIGPGGFTTTIQNPIIQNAGTAMAGTYTVVATAQNGCTSQQTVQVPYGATVPHVTSANVINPSCGSMQNGAIDITATGGTPPYLYSWTGPGGFLGNVEDLSGLIAGTYTLVVIDQTGCSSTQSFTITQAPAMTIATAVSNVTCSGPNSGAVSATVVGGVPPYNFHWSNNATTSTIGNLAAGQYTITVTDINGCTATATAVVTAPLPVIITGSVQCESAISAQASGGVAPYTYQWSNGATTPTITNLLIGPYSVTVYDANGCSATETFNLTPSATPCTRIVGQITLDGNANCQADVSEQGLGGWFLVANGPGGSFYGISDSSGRYEISVIPGAFTVSLYPQGWQPVICQNNVSVNLAQQGDSTVANFVVQVSAPNCPELSVSLGNSTFRRCFNTNYYYLHYSNNAPAPALNAYITLQLDPLLSIVAAQLPAIDLGNHLYRFNLGTVPPFGSGYFWVQVEVSCNATLGQTHCSTAHIYPDTPCQPASPQWTGALVDVTSVCQTDSLQFILKNIGSGAMSQPLDYIVIEDGIMTLQGSGSPLGPNQSMTISVPANGATWRVEANQEPLVPIPLLPVLSVEGCTTTGSFSLGFINQFPLNDASQWIDENCTPNVGSYDPNDKQGFPEGYGPLHYIRPGTELEYLIRFQNTGTDTAFNVVIRDTLSSWLDPTSVQPGASSQPYRFKLSGEGTLIFDFQNILLPDSFVNEPLSHGFVQFRVRPRADVPLETDILNRAAIYFDFNDPVLTNTTQHRIGVNFVTVGLWQPQRPEYAVQVAPHPLQEASWIALSGLPAAQQGEYWLRVFDARGQAIRTLSAAEPRFLLRKTDLPEGLYWFNIEAGGALLGSGKLMVR